VRASVSPKADVIEIEKNRRYGRAGLVCFGMILNTAKHNVVTINGVNVFIKNPASLEVKINTTRQLRIQRANKLFVE
tara:strand:- start:487 stop:717 length:231 start_codon:yes stop_codon:yes gene_type:complete